MERRAIEKMIREFIASYSSRRRVETAWREPVVGFAAADDPLFHRLKEVVRPTHATPGELLAGAKSVIAYFIPFAEDLHRENHESGYYCSRSWAVAYVETNRLISEINEYIREELRSEGYRVALVPPTHNFDQESLMSDWSHRHVAYVAGIGRFGVHNLLITEKGCTGRIGSLVTDLVLEPTASPRGEFCLQRAGYDCLECVERCRYGALYPDRYDRHACYRQCLANDRHYSDLDLTDVCGKCSAAVPCSVTNPVRERDQAGEEGLSS
ncbi:MAG: epoxyqueuosine reductase [Deltaproteobacteria bacterium]|nr:epoxyqueuosine reductase [Deltaproteobacteria bacterium]MBW2122632.1 epoxyqueuosine reductase [Deltaproteobacteria bacterium]